MREYREDYQWRRYYKEGLRRWAIYIYT